MEAVLEINQLSKSYGKLKALDRLDLKVFKGRVWGLLGPNGSGKTTTLGIILNVLNAESGNFLWFGKQASAESRKRVGAILETPNFYPYMSGRNNLKIVADIRQVPYKEIDAVIEWVGLKGRDTDLFRTYSLGMKQRLAIAAALLGNPDVLILDEPTNGLDPQGIAEVRQLITDISKKGITIILASHLLDEVEKVCTDVTILNKGKNLFSGSVAEVTGGSNMADLGCSDLDQLQKALRTWPGYKNCKVSGKRLLASFEDQIDGERLNQFLAEQGIFLSHLEVRQNSLEEQFLELLKDS